jgi:GTP-binding protein
MSYASRLVVVHANDHHQDHGKTTLVDALFKQGGVQGTTERAMDSSDQERERGITISAKPTSVKFGDMTLQIVDTPGHADFGGEVERSLMMVDGVVLLVDASEGPLPQTRFVLRKALAQGLPTVVVVNKVDRPDARIQTVLSDIYDLYIDVGATDEQVNFPVVYAAGRAGWASTQADVKGSDLKPLVDAIIKTIPPRRDRTNEAFSLQVNSLGYDDFAGRLVIGRILTGEIKPYMGLHVCKPDDPTTNTNNRVTGIFRFQGVKRLPLETARSGDIVALAGFPDAMIGDTIRAPESKHLYPAIKVDEPTVSVVFQVNDGPLAGKSGGKQLTSRQLKERLEKEAYANVSIRVLPGESSEKFVIMARGELQLAVLLETLRRELFEICVRNPKVITRRGEGGTVEEPTERLVIDLPSEQVGVVNAMMGPRKADLVDQKQEGSRERLTYVIPTRGLFGLHHQLMTATRGTALMSSVFEGWQKMDNVNSKMNDRVEGSIVSDRTGTTTAYGLFHLQPRGVLFVGEGTETYEGMIVGEHNKPNDLDVNPCKEKHMTNVRSVSKDEALTLTPPRIMTLERSFAWIRDDEMVEVTPNAIRLRKAVLKQGKRK